MSFTYELKEFAYKANPIVWESRQFFLNTKPWQIHNIVGAHITHRIIYQSLHADESNAIYRCLRVYAKIR